MTAATTTLTLADIQRIVRACNEETASRCMVPLFDDLVINTANVQTIDGTPVLYLATTCDSHYRVTEIIEQGGDYLSVGTDTGDAYRITFVPGNDAHQLQDVVAWTN